MPGHSLSLLEAGSTFDTESDSSMPQAVSSQPLGIEVDAFEVLFDGPPDRPGGLEFGTGHYYSFSPLILFRGRIDS